MPIDKEEIERVKRANELAAFIRSRGVVLAASSSSVFVLSMMTTNRAWWLIRRNNGGVAGPSRTVGYIYRHTAP